MMVEEEKDIQLCAIKIFDLVQFLEELPKLIESRKMLSPPIQKAETTMDLERIESDLRKIERRCGIETKKASSYVDRAKKWLTKGELDMVQFYIKRVKKGLEDDIHQFPTPIATQTYKQVEAPSKRKLLEIARVSEPELANKLLSRIGLTMDDFYRFRSVAVYDDGTMRVITREGRTGETSKEAIRKAGGYLTERYVQEEDPTYVYYFFKIPEHPKPETGAEFTNNIFRCRWCGAPFVYKENLDIHEKSCPERGR